MSYRFTKTEKWDDPWFRALPTEEKLVFIYLQDNCNQAGFYEIDLPAMTFKIGLCSDKIEGALKGLGRGLVGAKNWVWVKNYLRHQKNLPLNPENHFHKHIIECFKSQKDNFNLLEIEEYLGAIKGLLSPLGNIHSNIKGLGNEGGMGETKIVFRPEDLENFFLESQAWEEQTCMVHKIKIDALREYEKKFISDKKLKLKVYSEKKDAIEHFINWLTGILEKLNKSTKNGNLSKTERDEKLKNIIAERQGQRT